MIKTVIFDLGGVLVRTENPEPRRLLAERFDMTYQEIVELVYGSLTAARATRGEISAQDHKRAVLQTLNLPQDSFKSFRDEFWAGDVLDQGLVELIDSLRLKYTTALLSNAWDDLRPLLESYWKIDRVFDHIFISAELGLAKPDPEIYQTVITALNQDPSEMVFIDDFIENVQAARESRMNAIHFQNREHVLNELAEYLDLELQ
jgi:epoxide hydrolase-like predicted phosphatase